MLSSTLKRSAATLGVAAALLAAAVPAGATGLVGGDLSPTTDARPTAASTTQGIIMRDGGVCDPIRHMGC